MASKDSVVTRKYLAKGVIGQVGDDQPVLMTLRYVGTGTVTSVIVTTVTDITMITSDGGTDAYTWAAYTNMGALVAAINKDGIFEAKLLDCLTTTATTGSGLAIAGTLVAVNKEYKVLSDTSNALFLAYRLTYDRTWGNNKALRNGHRVSLQEIVTLLTLGSGADVNALKIYECTPSGNSAPYSGAEVLIYQKTPLTGATADVINWANGEGSITATDGNDLVVYVTDAQSITGTLTISGIAE